MGILPPTQSSESCCHFWISSSPPIKRGILFFKISWLPFDVLQNRIVEKIDVNESSLDLMKMYRDCERASFHIMKPTFIV